MTIRGRKSGAIFNHVILILLAAFALTPMFVLFFNSVKTRAEIGQNPLGPPQEIHLENFREAWVRGNFSTTVRNSVVLVLGTVSSVLVFRWFGRLQLGAS